MSGENAPLVPKDEEKGIGFGDRIVDGKQFNEFPNSTLQCARCTWITIVIGVTSTLIALTIAFFHGTVEVESQTVKSDKMPLRRIVICPSWGQAGMSLDVKALELGNLFTTNYPDWRRQNFTAQKCPPFKFYKFKRETPYLSDMRELNEVNQMGCVCIDSDVMLAPKSVGKDFARLALNAKFTNDPTKMLSIGLNGGGDDYPGDWNYVGLGVRTVADLTLETYIYGRTPLTRGTGIELFTLGVKNVLTLGSPKVDGADTEVVLAYGSYYENQILDYSAVFSFFALVSFVAIVVAVINSMQIFNLCFPESVDPDDPQQLQPSMLFQSTLGLCFSCCRKKKGLADS